MGLASNYPFALAPGMGLNAAVAFELVAGRGLSWPQAMTVVFLEGLVITLRVLTRLRPGVMVVRALLASSSMMLTAFFDTRGTVIAVGAPGGSLDARGRLPGVGRVLLVDS